MQLYFIRHAQSENNALWAQTGSDNGRVEDPDLTGLGLQQAQCLAEALREGGPKTPTYHRPQPDGEAASPGIGLTHLYTSLMLRSVRTGAILAAALDLPLLGWEELHERGGIYRRDPQTGEVQLLPGRDRRFFEQHFPGLALPEDLPEPGWWNFRAYETAEACTRRAGRFLKDLLERHGGREDRVAVVSHGAFYNEVMRTALRLEATPEEKLWFGLYNTAVTRIDFFDTGVEMVYLNRVDHLPVELIT